MIACGVRSDRKSGAITENPGKSVRQPRLCPERSSIFCGNSSGAVQSCISTRSDILRAIEQYYAHETPRDPASEKGQG
mgnify:CR=1 FL=1